MKHTILAISLVSALCFLITCNLNPNSSSPPNTACGNSANGYFSIYSPLAGNAYKMGTRDTLRWTNTTSQPPTSVAIQLYNGEKYVSTITTSLYNIGSYPYTVPSVGSGTKYRIKIRSIIDTNAFDYGCYFILYSDYSGSYAITSPSKAASCTTGTVNQIAWQILGTPGSSATLQLCSDSVPLSYISSVTAGAQTYAWTIPAGLVTANNYRIKITSSYDAGIYSFSAPFFILGLQPDAYEPDNIRDSARLCTLGKAQQHTLTLGDTDWVKFSVDSASTYVVQVLGTVPTAGYLYSGTLAAYSAVLSGGTTTSTSTTLWTSPKGGVFNAKIFNAGGLTGSYSFSVAKYDSSALVTFAAPTVASTWAAGSNYSIQWSADSLLFGTPVSIYLYKGSTLISSLGSASYGSAFPWTIPAGLATGSDYRIRVSNYYNSAIAGFSQPFTISGLAPDKYEPDNTRSTASSLLPLGKSQSHTITFSDTDWVKFSADSGATYLVQCYGTTSTYTYIYFDTLLSYLTYFSGGSTASTSARQWQSPKKGTYYARITPSSSSLSYAGGSYEFNITPFDSMAMITCVSPTAASTWATGAAYSIQWVPDTSILGTQVYLYLYKGSSFVYSIGTTLNSGTYLWTIPAPLATGSDYRIKIMNYSNTLLGGYSSVFSISGLTPDAYEPDNNRALASKFSPIGKPQSHNLPLGDTDWVQFSADSGAQYILQCYGTMSTYVYLYYNTDVSYTTSFTGSTSAAASTSTWTCLVKGTYYARITPYSSSISGSGGTYSFNVMKYDSLAMITFANPTAASTWNSGSSYAITWTPDSTILGTSVAISLYRGTQLIQSILSGISNSGTYNWTVPASLGTASNYRIKIVNYSNASLGGFSPSFTISGIVADAYEPDDTASKASVLVTDGTFQSHTMPSGDVDWMSFPAKKDSLYVITGVSDATLSLYLYLYASPTSSALTYQYGVNPKFIWTCPQSGTYYIKAQASSTVQYGSYKISAKAYSSTGIVSFVNPSVNSTFSAGSSYSLQWIADTALFGASVRLQLYADTTLVQTITSSTSNTGTYTWVPPPGIATGSKYSIKLSSYLTPLLAGKSGFFTISGLDPDDYEPDDSLEIAHAIATLGVAEAHTLPLNDIDWFKYSAVANNVYLIKTTGTTRTMATQISLYGIDGKALGLTATSTSADSSASVVYYCSVSGNYFFKTNSTTTGSYKASVVGYDSTKYGLSVTAPKAGDSNAAGQLDTIQWSSAVDFGGYVDIFLYNAGGIVQTIAANVANTKSYLWTIAATTAAGSGYYVKVASKLNSNIFGISGAFTIQ